ncbi:tetratricopeptide repeat protein [Bacillus aquiflavi]|uniref:Tetratricopeptide repeat protein n=1 Tax=Bacillus aquiflavi TaxID=2672567 RepID=A0A6B3VXK5_9BACI|nr:tetratricopeptide repeat protein [Bacillus aquiflavi]MBA4536089.1 tetratricopeptide repeat protein [Bacillus aquiflavi]NEY80463.1 tetratricopeptide repeat protein [Bacillus aquiflavi]
MEIIEHIAQLLQSGKHDEAFLHINKIMKNGLDNEKFLLGETLFHYGFLEEAKKLFKDLLSRYPNEGELLVLYAEILMEKGEEDEAILALEKIDHNDDFYPQALLLLADLYQMEGLYEVSEQKLLDAKKLLPDEPVIDFALGELYAAEGKFVEAINAYERILTDNLNITGVNINQRLAEVLSAAGRFEEALPYYDKALKENLEINTLFGYGFTALQAGYHNKAIETFLELKELDHEYHSLYLYLAKAYEREEELVKSFETVKKGISLDEFNKDLFFYGGKIALKLGKQQEAEELLRQAIALDPSFTEAVLTLNKLFLTEERYEEIIDLVNELEKYGEEEPQFYWDRAIAYQHLEQYSYALNQYRLAYTFFKNNHDFLHDYGYFLIEEGKTKDAGEIFNKLLKLNPSNDEYVQILERLLED